MKTKTLIVLTVSVMMSRALTARAGGLIPDRNNQLLIQGQFGQPTPEFVVVFSAKPLNQASGKPAVALTVDEFGKLTTNADQVVLTLSGKPASKEGRVDYFFANESDKDRPWNNGRDFKWEDWEKHSADIWDHLAIMQSPSSKGSCVIHSVTLRRGGKMLFDSRATQSYPNKLPIKVALKPTTLTVQRGRLPVLNLSDAMREFRIQYYELGTNPILQMAYSDLGQTEKRKYANRGNNWCSEFTSFIYRTNKIDTPDPNRADVHFRNMRDALSKEGSVYTLREVATWSDADKLSKIKPGSFVSIKLGDATHSLIFTTWIKAERGQPITKYAAISGNNKGMVWAHDPLSLPGKEDTQSLSTKELADFDDMVYFGVPRTPTAK